MRVSLNWLKEFLPDLSWNVEQLSDKLAIIGHECDKVDDQTIDVVITPNRVDCQSVFGLARDLAGVYGLKLHSPTLRTLPKASQILPVTIDRSAEKDIIADILVSLQNYKPTKSPKEIQKKLAVLELESKDLLIDLSNVVAHEFGVPLHVFDYAKIKSGLTIRRGEANESITLLNGAKVSLSKANLIQASNSKLVDLAGIKGGQDGSLTNKTKSVVVQAAIFSPATVRQSSRSALVQTPASVLYSRGIDQTAVPSTLQSFVDLALKYAPQLKDLQVQIVRQSISAVKPTLVTTDFLSRYLGLSISQKDLQLLEKTGFAVNGNEVTPPSYRPDMDSAQAISGELIRLLGYDKLKAKYMSECPAVNSPNYDHLIQVKNQLALLGLTETLSLALTRTRGTQEIVNSGSTNTRYLRSSLKEGLLETVAGNQFIRNPAFFEVGNVFLAKNEEERLGVVVGQVTPELQQMLAHIFGAPAAWQEITQTEKDQYKIRLKKVFYFEHILITPKNHQSHLSEKSIVPPNTFRPISKFPPAYRDITLVLEAGKEAEKTVLNSFLAIKEILICEVIDRYFDDQKVGTGKVATTFRLLFQRLDRSFTDTEVNALIESHFQVLKKQVPFEQR